MEFCLMSHAVAVGPCTSEDDDGAVEWWRQQRRTAADCGVSMEGPAGTLGCVRQLLWELSICCGDLVEFDYSFSSYGHIGFLDSLCLLYLLQHVLSLRFLPFDFLSFLLFTLLFYQN